MVGMAEADVAAVVGALVAAVSSASESNPISQRDGGGSSGEEDSDQEEADALLASAEVVDSADEWAEEVSSAAGLDAEEEAEEEGESSSKAAEAALEPTSNQAAADDEAATRMDGAADGAGKSTMAAVDSDVEAAVKQEPAGKEVAAALEAAALQATWQETSTIKTTPWRWSGMDDVWLQFADEITCRADVTRQVNVDKQVAAVVGHEHEQRVVVPFFLFSSSPEVSSAFPAAPPHSLFVHIAVMLPWPFVSAGGQGIGAAPRWVFLAMLVHPALQAWH